MHYRVTNYPDKSLAKVIIFSGYAGSVVCHPRHANVKLERDLHNPLGRLLFYGAWLELWCLQANHNQDLEQEKWRLWRRRWLHHSQS